MKGLTGNEERKEANIQNNGRKDGYDEKEGSSEN